MYDAITSVSIIIPARNEAAAIGQVLASLKDLYSSAEIIVVDDGSTDHTYDVCEAHQVWSLRHPYSIGNGAAIKTGVRSAQGEYLVFMDADGQHDPEDIHRLLEKLFAGYDMVIGARSIESQASLGRGLANALYNRFASWVVGRPISDLTSGFRACRKDKFCEFLHLLPNGFSYPTTSTMAFLRSGYSVAFVPITAKRRIGKSHIRLRDGIRFLVIIFRIATLYSPLKIFTPISAALAVLGLGHYFYSFVTYGRFTNMSALLLLASLLIFVLGLLSEQITLLLYQRAVSR